MSSDGSAGALESFVVACCLTNTGLMHFAGNHVGPTSVETQAYPCPHINSSHGPVQAPDCKSRASTFALGRTSAFCNDRKWVRIGGDSRDAGSVRWFQLNTVLCRRSRTLTSVPGTFLSRSGSYLHEGLCFTFVQSVANLHARSADADDDESWHNFGLQLATTFSEAHTNYNTKSRHKNTNANRRRRDVKRIP